MIVPPDMEVIRKIANGLEEEIKSLEVQLKETSCSDKINELRTEIKNKGLTLYGYQRTLSSRKYN